ncbi:RNA polymerase sigma factor [Psychroflexus aestuariivivens]|uniref:RNA polymerase sigma factor n=1 Tax=Psychroflexus aestuariivivens TaxID=1795040 RepID=UPI000FD9C18A|nr:RNA polymerase sigma factor [Psychroflexus aestuariivivens]
MNIKKLIKQCKKQEISAQKSLYDLYSDKLFSLSLKYSKNYAEAQDNLQDAFIKIFQKIEQYQHKGSFEGWMKRIVINTTLQKYRQQKVFELINEEALQAKEIYVEEDEISLAYLLECIQSLPNRYRLVFNLYVLDGFSHREIASKLNISEGTSKSNLSRARDILKRKIEASQEYKIKRQAE